MLIPTKPNSAHTLYCKLVINVTIVFVDRQYSFVIISYQKYWSDTVYFCLAFTTTHLYKEICNYFIQLKNFKLHEFYFRKLKGLKDDQTILVCVKAS